MTALDQFKVTYFQECEEQLAALEQHLRDLKSEPKSRETLDAAFRSVHTIKGGASMFRLDRMVGLAHAIETVLALVRDGRLTPTRRVADKLLAATDVLSDLADAARSDREPPEAVEVEAMAALDALGQSSRRAGRREARTDLPGDRRHSGVSGEHARAKLSSGHQSLASQPADQPLLYRIRFEPGSDLLRRGFEPLAIFRNLQALGGLRLVADTSGLPNFETLDPAQLHIRWTAYLTTQSPRAVVSAVFDFVAGSAAVDIEEVPSPALQIADAPRPGAPAGDRRGTPDRRVGSIRVELPRVERLVDLVGEITIAQAMVLQHLDHALVSQNPLLFRALTDLLKLSRTLQDNVMAIRAQPIQTIFARMHRIARDSAAKLGREVELVTRGEATELDKTTVEQLADPLMHIVRNAIYHGIEQPDVRIAAGKPAQGSIVLSAQQRGSRIVVEVADDGAGIDRAAVLKRAVAMGVVGEDDALADGEIDNLIFSPGLSTASSVSDFAGRGVGLDVVHQNIRKLGGQIAIRSTPGRGTTTTISLPVTLAVLDAMKMNCAGETYIVPMGHIVECLVVPRADIRDVPGVCRVIDVRGHQVRVISLAQQFGLATPTTAPRAAIVVCELDDGSLVGLMVDEVSGHQQVVVKTLRDPALAAIGFSGATILGDGNVALILDVNQLATGAALTASRTPRSMRVEANMKGRAA